MTSHLWQEYQALSRLEGCHPDTWANLACCHFMLGQYAEADAATERGKGRGQGAGLVLMSVVRAAPRSSLRNRLQFHLAHKASHTHCIPSLTPHSLPPCPSPPSPSIPLTPSLLTPSLP